MKITWKRTVMNIVWRNPNKIVSKGVRIVKTGRLEAPHQLQLFYRSASGVGILGTEFELRVNRKPLHAA